MTTYADRKPHRGVLSAAAALPAPIVGRAPRRGVRTSDEIIRVVIADDHAMFREGLKVLLRMAPDIEVVGEASNGEEAVAVAMRMRPSVVILDLDMPRLDGAAVVVELKRMLPDARALILTMHSEQERLLPLLAAGARGYMSKVAAALELFDAVRVVAAGEVYVRPVAARLLAGEVVLQSSAETARGRFKLLSRREQTILRLIATGYSGAEVARQLAISTKTVDAYKHRIEDKLGLAHRTEYVRFACEAGIIDVPAPR